MPTKKRSKRVTEMDREYQIKRQRNNDAVKRSREKARQKNMEVHGNIQKLRNENKHLEARKALLSKELELYKELFRKHCGSSKGDVQGSQDLDLATLLMGST